MKIIIFGSSGSIGQSTLSLLRILKKNLDFEILAITGNENIVMEVIFKDQLHLEKFIDELISYGETKTQIILSEVISSQEIRKM